MIPPKKPERPALLRRVADAQAEIRAIRGGDFHGTTALRAQRLDYLRHEIGVGTALLQKFYPEATP